jgi:hypothetical protein
MQNTRTINLLIQASLPQRSPIILCNYEIRFKDRTVNKILFEFHKVDIIKNYCNICNRSS